MKDEILRKRVIIFSKNYPEKLYNCLELFSNINEAGHFYSVQRVRVGADYKRYQFGPGIDLSAFGDDYASNPTNFGFFIRSNFDNRTIQT